VPDASNGIAAAAAVDMISDRRFIRGRSIRTLQQKYDAQPPG
jgi:hypothetical protein